MSVSSPSLSGPAKGPRLDHLKAGRKARFIYLYLPELALRRMMHIYQLTPGTPLALYQQIKGADRLRDCNDVARSFGLEIGMSLSDARALCALCRFYEVNEEADAKWLARLARWCWRYSPVVGIDPDRHGLWIDSTGADHLWGGEQEMANDIISHFETYDMPAHIVIASSYGGALGVAITCLPPQPLIIQEADLKHTLQALPVSALRLSQEQTHELAQIGLLTIDDLSQLKRGMIAMRFGEDIIRRRDQAFGDVPERPHPLAALQPVMVQQHYHEPIGGLASLDQMVSDLLRSLAEMLSDMMLGCRMVEIGWQTLDGHTGTIKHHLSRPSREAQLFQRLFKEAGATIYAGFGIEYSWVKAAGLSAQMPQAMIFDDTGRLYQDEGDKLSQLVDHLAARLGAEHVQRLNLAENWIPELSQSFITAQKDMQAHADGHDAATGLLIDQTLIDEAAYESATDSPRPMRLFSPAEPVQAIALLPDHPPSQLRWRKQNWRIRRATGPERIGPRWWQARKADDVVSRDYYRLETETGHRLWVYRSGLPERGEPISWHLHGVFA